MHIYAANAFNRLKKLKLQIKQRFPTKLPKTQEQFDKMISEILAANDLPDNPSYKHAIASAIMHLGPLVNAKPNMYFVKSVHKSISNQVAYELMRRLEREEKEKSEAKDGSDLQITS